MNYHKPHEWNKLVYYLSDVYRATSDFRPGEQNFLGNRIRKTAISLSVAMNSMPERVEKPDFRKIYPILSAISVLETYLELARQYGYLKNTANLREGLQDVKNILYELLDETEEDDS